MLESFGLQYISSQLPPWLYRVINSACTVALFKSSDQDPTKLRPVGVKYSFIKEVITLNKMALRDYLEPQQLALTHAGGDKLVHAVQINR